MNTILNKNYVKESEWTYTEKELIVLDDLPNKMKFQSFESYDPKKYKNKIFNRIPRSL